MKIDELTTRLAVFEQRAVAAECKAKAASEKAEQSEQNLLEVDSLMRVNRNQHREEMQEKSSLVNSLVEQFTEEVEKNNILQAKLTELSAGESGPHVTEELVVKAKQAEACWWSRHAREGAMKEIELHEREAEAEVLRREAASAAKAVRDLESQLSDLTLELRERPTLNLFHATERRAATAESLNVSLQRQVEALASRSLLEFEALTEHKNYSTPSTKSNQIDF